MRVSVFKSGLLASVILPVMGVLGPLASADEALANPVLMAKDYFSGDNQQVSQALEIKRLDLSVTLLPGYAETTAVVEFYNGGEDQLEGEFLLDMPTGSIIIGYGLDIDGEMIDGVLVEKKKAKKAFEDRIRAGIDPGLAEITRENAFKTRIFPINPEDSRTVKLTFLSPISETQPYRLPLSTAAPVGALSISVTAEGLDARPAVSLPGQMRFAWREDGSYGRAVGQHITPEGALTITPQSAAGFVIERQPSGEKFLSVSLDAPEMSAGKAPKTIRVYWDSSLSNQGAMTGERETVSAILNAFGSAKVDLIPFASALRKDAILLRAKPGDVIEAIEAIDYNGATNLEALYANEASRRSADICLLVSDGRATLGDVPLGTLDCKLFTLSGAADADRGALQMLAQRSGGQFIDTNATNSAQIRKLLTSDTPYLKSVKIDGRELSDKAVWSSDGDQLRLLVPVPTSADEVSVDFGTVSSSRRFNQMPNFLGNRLGAVWANQWIVQAEASGASRDDIVALSQTYSVASNVTSFLVLETVQDYANARIALPAKGFDKAQRAEYAEWISNVEAEDNQARDNRLANVIAAWKSQIEWYEASYEWVPGVDEMKKQGQDDGTVATAAPPMPMRSMTDAEPMVEQPAAQDRARVSNSPEEREMSGLIGNMAGAAEGEFDDEIVVTGTRIDQDVQDVTSVIEIKPWSPERPYLDAVKDQCGAAFAESYFAQRPEYGSLPGFYLEMADARAACGDKSAAAEIALSALELDAANTDTITAVANRLLSYGQTDTAVALLTQVTDADPDRPQPWRDLALALEVQAAEPGLKKRERRALLGAALDHLNHVIATPWDGAYDGIELISVMEANRIAERLRKLNGEAHLPDKALERLLDVDLRIVVTWNIDDVDMDLWVNEPTGEKSFYGYALTQIGGRLSNDMTAGYGPEEYLLKQAVAGEYTIEMNYYSSDIINPNGAVTLRAHIYRNWGRASQSVSVVDLEFTDQADSNYLVAKLNVE